MVGVGWDVIDPTGCLGGALQLDDDSDGAWVHCGADGFSAVFEFGAFGEEAYGVDLFAVYHSEVFREGA